MNHSSTSRVWAAVFQEAGNSLELQSFPLPDVDVGEALIAIDCCTICGSDVHTARGDRPVAGPTVLGHEALGRVIVLPAKGPPVCDVAGVPLAVGDRVTWSVAACCGGCFFCQHGLPQKCQQLFKYGHETIARSALSGGLAQVCHLQRGTAIVRVPSALSDRVACPANCATATVAAACRVAGGCAGKSLVIHGAGMLGLTAAAMAAEQGAAVVIVTDIRAERLQRATHFGATHAINANDPAALMALIRECTDDRGADLILEMSGAPANVEQAIAQLRIGGQLILVGAVFATRAAQVFPEQVIRKLLRIDGVHNYTPQDLAAAVEFLEQAAPRYPLQSLVDPAFSLSEINAAFTAAADSAAIRVAVTTTLEPDSSG